MVMGRIDMSTIREVLRLTYEHKLSRRKVAESCGISRPTVSEYLERAIQNGIEWATDKLLNDTEKSRNYLNMSRKPNYYYSPDNSSSTVK
jgi:predicted transcriptional regulator